MPSCMVNSDLLRKKMRVRQNEFRRNYDLYLLIAPASIFFIIFRYWPMYGVQIAFRDYIVTEGIWGSPWVGIEHFQRFFRSYYFSDVLSNTLGLSFYQLIVGFPMSIILALLLNEVKNMSFKKFVQTVSYAPHFISTVVMVGMLVIFLEPKGLVNNLLSPFLSQRVSFMSEKIFFKSIYVFSGVWQNTGWGSIIYLAALAGINRELYEASGIDGATRLQKILHITIPGIMPTAVIMLILNVGRIMSIGFEKVFLMQNPLNIESSEIISTYVYKMGLLGGQYSFAAAVGLFNALINFVLLLSVNKLARKLGDSSLW